LAAVLLLPGLLWLVLSGLPIAATVRPPVDGVRRVALRLGPAGWAPVPIGLLSARAGEGVSPEISLSCPALLRPGRDCAGEIRLVGAPSGPLMLRLERRWMGLSVGQAEIIVPGAASLPSRRR
jgi:hypothetical protein